MDTHVAKSIKFIECALANGGVFHETRMPKDLLVQHHLISKGLVALVDSPDNECYYEVTSQGEEAYLNQGTWH